MFGKLLLTSTLLAMVTQATPLPVPTAEPEPEPVALPDFATNFRTLASRGGFDFNNQFLASQLNINSFNIFDQLTFRDFNNGGIFLWSPFNIAAANFAQFPWTSFFGQGLGFDALQRFNLGTGLNGSSFLQSVLFSQKFGDGLIQFPQSDFFFANDILYDNFGFGIRLPPNLFSLQFNQGGLFNSVFYQNVPFKFDPTLLSFGGVTGGFNFFNRLWFQNSNIIDIGVVGAGNAFFQGGFPSGGFSGIGSGIGGSGIGGIGSGIF